MTVYYSDTVFFYTVACTELYNTYVHARHTHAHMYMHACMHTHIHKQTNTHRQIHTAHTDACTHITHSMLHLLNTKV